MEVKKCNICGATKEITLFPSNGLRKGIKTYKPFCKYCKKIMRNNELRDKIIIVRGNPVAIPSEERIKKLEYQKAYRERNKETLRAKAKVYYDKIYPIRKDKILKQQSIARKKRIAKKQQEKINLIRLANVNNNLNHFYLKYSN